MSDNELFESEEEIAGEEAASGGKKIGFLPGMVIQILKWVGIVLAAIIFVVTVVVVTLGFMGDRMGSQTRIPVDSESYADRLPVYDWHSLDELRGTTRDGSTFIIQPHIGYDPGAQAVLTEILSRRIQIRSEILLYFNSQDAAFLQNHQNRTRIQSDLVTRLNNNIMRSGRVRDIAFDVFTIIAF